MPFKKGAFQGMRTVIPAFVTFKRGQVSPAYDTVEFLPLLIMLMSSFEPITCKLTVMPEFTPNTIMLDKHGGGRESWEVYAECVRDAMSKHSGIPKKDDKCSNKDKEGWYKFMQCKTDFVEVDGRRYVAPESSTTRTTIGKDKPDMGRNEGNSDKKKS